MFFGSPLYDLFLIIFGVFLVKIYVFENDLSEHERLFMNHTSKWIRCAVVISMIIALVYTVGCDMGLLDGHYYEQSVFYLYIASYLGAVWGIYIDYKYKAKDYECVEKLKLRVQAAICIPLLFLLLHFLTNKH